MGEKWEPRSCFRPSFLLSHPTQDPPDLGSSTQPLPLFQATGISQELFQKTYAFCVRLLTLPAPYCTVALDCAIRLKTESAAPGKSCPR